MPNKNHYIIDSLQQIKAICSPIRQEIMDAVIAKGTCSITDIAVELGRPADGLYYHIRALIKENLLEDAGENQDNPRQETLYTLPQKASLIKVNYNHSDAEKIQAIKKMVKSMLKINLQDFENGLKNEHAVFEGELRNIWAGRVKNRLNQNQIKKVNILLNELMNVFKQSTDQSSEELYTMQWVLAPIESRPKRRS